jgi:hypothetical protein
MKAFFEPKIIGLIIGLILTSSCQTRSDAVQTGTLKAPDEGVFDEYQPSPSHKRPVMKLYRQLKDKDEKKPKKEPGSDEE